MASVRAQFRAVLKSKSLRECFDNIPWEFPEMLALCSVAVFLCTTVYQLYTDLFASYPYFFATNLARRMGLWLGGIALLITLAKRTQEKTTVTQFFSSRRPLVWFLVLMALMLLSTLVNGFTYYALHGDSYRRESLFVYLTYFALYYGAASAVSRQKCKKLLLYLFVICSIIVNITVLFATYVLHREEFIAHEEEVRLNGIFHQYNHYGYYLATVIVLCAMLTVLEQQPALRMLSLAGFAVGTAALTINNTFGCVLACFAALIFDIAAVSLAKRRFSRASLLMLLLFLAITVLLSFRFPTIFSKLIRFKNDVVTVVTDTENAQTAGASRWFFWTETLKCILERPLLGHGVEGITERLFIASGGYNNRPHNEYLQYAAFFGIPALIAYLGGLLSVFLHALKNRSRIDCYSLAALGAAFVYLCSACFGNTMYYTAPYLMIFLGLSFNLTAAEQA